MFKQGEKLTASKLNTLAQARTRAPGSMQIGGQTYQRKVAFTPPAAAAANSPRRAYTAAAGATDYMTCRLDSAGGTSVTVYFDIFGGGNLEDALPTLEYDDVIWVAQDISGNWYNITTFFAATTNCTGT